MKRLLIVASLAILAIGCQKTFVENEVKNQIGFSTEIDKMTRTVNTTTTFQNTDFTVFSYGYQGENGAHDGVMAGVTVTKDDNYTATGYYWPNSTDTYLNFYAYSPADLGFAHSENAETGFYTEDGKPYIHTSEYTDFMVATPVKKATFTDQNGDGTPDNDGVDILFNHQLTQVVFTVKSTINDVDAKLHSITLKGVSNTASYTQNRKDDESSEYYPWYDHVYPGTEYILTVDETNVTTNPVVLLPQSVTGLTFDIEYSLSGDNIANERVVKRNVNLPTSLVPVWKPNMRVEYTANISLTAITFVPKVGKWDEASDDVTIVQ